MVRKVKRKRADGISMRKTEERKCMDTMQEQLGSNDLWLLVNSLYDWSSGIKNVIAECRAKADEKCPEIKESDQTVRMCQVKVRDNVVGISDDDDEWYIEEPPEEVLLECLLTMSKNEDSVAPSADSSSTNRSSQRRNLDLLLEFSTAINQIVARDSSKTKQLYEEVDQQHRNMDRIVSEQFEKVKERMDQFNKRVEQVAESQKAWVLQVNDVTTEERLDELEVSDNGVVDGLEENSGNDDNVIIQELPEEVPVKNLDWSRMIATMNQMTAQMEEELERLRNLNKRFGVFNEDEVKEGFGIENGTGENSEDQLDDAEKTEENNKEKDDEENVCKKERDMEMGKNLNSELKDCSLSNENANTEDLPKSGATDSCGHGERRIEDLPGEVSTNCLQDVLSMNECSVVTLASSSSTGANISYTLNGRVTDGGLSARGKRKESKVCWTCNKEGHISRDCWRRRCLQRGLSSQQMRNKGRQVRCWTCRELGHISRHCCDGDESRVASSTIARKRWRRSGRMTCWVCQKVGHISLDCWKKDRK